MLIQYGDCVPLVAHILKISKHELKGGSYMWGARTLAQLPIVNIIMYEKTISHKTLNGLQLSIT